MSLAEPTLSETQLAAFREQLAADPIEYDGLVAEYDADEDSYHIETPARQTTLTADELSTVDAEGAAYISNWYFYTQEIGSEVTQAFCRWLEGADDRGVPDRYAALDSEIDREWGQLSITTTLAADGTRRYEVRHVGDTDADADALTTHTDPFDARDIGTLDPDGRYRPLRTAPSLDTGWIFPELTANELYETVEAFYPATIVNWHREQRGELDIDHWRDEQDRQRRWCLSLSGTLLDGRRRGPRVGQTRTRGDPDLRVRVNAEREGTDRGDHRCGRGRRDRRDP